MRKTPSGKTLKKLFALSGNLCAFPSCKNILVDEVGNLIGQICHIEAAEKGGERYNPAQTDEQRASFDNLIILCANHHIVTNDVGKYSVESLKEIKKAHESRYLENIYAVTENSIDQAIKQLTQVQNNNFAGAGQQLNVQGQSVVVHQGMSTGEVISLVQQLYDANFPKLMDAAKEEASKNISRFEADFRSEVSKKLSQKELEKFSDPDIQVALYEAVAASARKDDSTLRKLLANLVVQRVKNDDFELKQKVLNEAISTISKITVDQMKILTLCFMFRHAAFQGISTWDQLKASFEKSMKPFIDFKGSNTEVLHLQYAGCGKIEEVFSYDPIDHLRTAYSIAFLHPLTQEELNSLGLGDETMKEIFSVDDKGNYLFIFRNKEELKKFLTNKGIEDHLIDRVTSIYEQKIMNPEDVKTKFETELPWSKSLFNHLRGAPNHLSLTSVGMAIAITYYEQIVGNSLDIDIWIN